MPGQDAWHGDFFANAGLQGSPVSSRDDAAINFDWGSTAPVPKLSQATNWSARWDFDCDTARPGYYTVSAYADDGVRVWVDDQTVIDEWHDSSPTTYAAMVYLDAGEHDWRIEYYQHQGTASLRVQIAPGASLPSDTFQAGPDSDAVTFGPGSPYFVQGGRAGGWETTDDGNGGTAVRTNNLLFGQADSNWVRWYAALAHPGMYDVSVFLPAGIGTTRAARYWISHADANDPKVLNQSLYAGQWVSLGEYYFNAAGD
ncbi:MAG: PA14 domain-containing protein, partial [Chloroflexi bacterium]|nr:PA14 domain-containing protein [Chloroflexota bacterium]